MFTFVYTYRHMHAQITEKSLHKPIDLSTYIPHKLSCYWKVHDSGKSFPLKMNISNIASQILS